jgi:hypothetical protein
VNQIIYLLILISVLITNRSGWLPWKPPAWPLSDKLPPKKAFPFIFISGGRRVALYDEEAMEENSLC